MLVVVLTTVAATLVVLMLFGIVLAVAASRSDRRRHVPPMTSGTTPAVPEPRPAPDATRTTLAAHDDDPVPTVDPEADPAPRHGRARPRMRW